jgi:predicted flavoprotein YhiN
VLKRVGVKTVEQSDLKKVVEVLKNFNFSVNGLPDSKDCQVMCGGVDVGQLNGDCSVKSFDGLFACGECLDVDGLCGGFNLHFAFASGIIAGESV